jgi:hypothetical protein
MLLDFFWDPRGNERRVLGRLRPQSVARDSQRSVPAVLEFTLKSAVTRLVLPWLQVRVLAGPALQSGAEGSQWERPGDKKSLGLWACGLISV